MRKKSLALTLMLAFSCILGGNLMAETKYAIDEEHGQTLYYAITNTAPNTVKVTYPNESTIYSGSSAWNTDKPTGNITIPSYVTIENNTYDVTAIDKWAFYNCSDITEVYIPNTVTQIGLSTSGNGASFYGCSKLASVTIPNSVTLIGFQSFYNCSKLESITIPNSVTQIGDSAFDGCIKPKSLTIPSNVTTLSTKAFQNCTGLESVTFNSGITGISTLNSYVFKGCTNLIEVNFSNASLRTISAKAFENCTSLETITIPSCVTTINANPFYGCTALNEIIVIDGGKYNSGSGANGIFQSNQLIVGCKSTIIPSNVTVIYNYAFNGCTGLEAYDIPLSIRSIGGYAFEGCTNLESVTIPSSITTFGEHMFEGCTSLNNVTINTTSVTTISNSAFKGCNNLTNFTIPSSITSIKSDAFNGCSSLTNIIIPSNVTTIESQAFMNCGMSSVIIPSSVTSIGNQAFYMSSITSVYMMKTTAPTLGGTEPFKKGYKSYPNIYTLYSSDHSILNSYKPGSGNWNTYKDLVTEIPNNYRYVDGAWLSDAGGTPTSTSFVTIEDDITLTSNLTIANLITNGGILTIPSPYIVNVSGSATCNTHANLVIADGGQLILPTTSTGVQATVKKETYGATAKDAKTDYYYWYAISSAVANPSISSATNIASGTYDLYRYNEAKNAELPWENYKNDAYSSTFTTLEKGRGYLYRNDSDLSIAMTGEVNVADFNYAVTKTGSGVLAGFNLIGNPYSHDIYKGDGTAIPNGTDFLRTGFYYMEPTTGKWTTGTDNSTAIKPNEAIFVQTDANGNITMTNTNASSSAKANNDNIMFKVANSQYSDEAYAWFDKGRGLNKISHRNAEVPMLYINQDGENYAIATMSNDIKTFSLNFKAMTMGKYTLSYKTKGEFNYLHVIDRFTGEDVDMLLEGEYSFVASPNDSDARFIVRLEYTSNNGTNDSSVFAYQSGNEIIVSGEGELQIFDVMGRKISTHQINGVETVNVNAHGVYIFKLNEKTQKIIIK